MSDLLIMGLIAGSTAGLPTLGGLLTLAYQMGKVKKSVEGHGYRIGIVETTQAVDGQRISTLEGRQLERESR